MVPLDDVLLPLREQLHLPVSLVKIDVEGYEAGVISGAWQTIVLDEPVLAIEIADSGELAAISESLSALGYRRLQRFCATPTYVFAKRRELSWAVYRGTRLASKLIKRVIRAAYPRSFADESLNGGTRRP